MSALRRCGSLVLVDRAGRLRAHCLHTRLAILPANGRELRGGTAFCSLPTPPAPLVPARRRPGTDTVVVGSLCDVRQPHPRGGHTMAAFVAAVATPRRGAPLNSRTRCASPARAAEGVGVAASSFGGQRAAVGRVSRQETGPALTMVAEGTCVGFMPPAPVFSILFFSFLVSGDACICCCWCGEPRFEPSVPLVVLRDLVD